MKFTALALAVGLSAAASSAAHAGPLFDSFQTVCAKTDAAPAAAMAATDAAGGWMPLPDALLQQLSASLGVDGGQGRLKSDAGGLSVVIVGHKKMPAGGTSIDVRFCAVGAAAATNEPVGDELAAWAAVPAAPGMAGEGRTGYFFSDNDGVHAALSDPNSPQSLALIRSGRAKIAMSQAAKSMTLLAYAVPTL